MSAVVRTIEKCYLAEVQLLNRLQPVLLLLLRLYIGYSFFKSGWGKLQNISTTAEYFAGLGIPLPALNAYLAGATECFGGLLLSPRQKERLTALAGDRFDLTRLRPLAYKAPELQGVERWLNSEPLTLETIARQGGGPQFLRLRMNQLRPQLPLVQGLAREVGSCMNHAIMNNSRLNNKQEIVAWSAS